MFRSLMDNPGVDSSHIRILREPYNEPNISIHTYEKERLIVRALGRFSYDLYQKFLTLTATGSAA